MLSTNTQSNMRNRAIQSESLLSVLNELFILVIQNAPSEAYKTSLGAYFRWAHISAGRTFLQGAHFSKLCFLICWLK